MLIHIYFQQPGIEPRSPGPLANTLPIRPMSWYFFWIAFINSWVKSWSEAYRTTIEIGGIM